MAEQESGPGRLEVAILGTEAYVRVTGRGTFRVSPGLRSFGKAAIGVGCRRLTMFMENCSSMDSTFLGVIAGLALQLRQRGGELVMLNVSAKNRALVANLGLGSLISMGEFPTDRARETPQMHTLYASADKRTLEETMLSAHEHLINIAPQNAPKFKDLLAYLRENLGQREEGEDARPLY